MPKFSAITPVLPFTALALARAPVIAFLSTPLASPLSLSLSLSLTITALTVITQTSPISVTSQISFPANSDPTPITFTTQPSFPAVSDPTPVAFTS